MSIPELLCYWKVCTLLALSLIRHCSCLSIILNMKILSENKTEAQSNTRGIALHIQLLSELSLRYLSDSLELAETDGWPEDSPVPPPPRAFLQGLFLQWASHLAPPFCWAAASVPPSLYLPRRIDVDDILGPTLQVSCRLSCKEDFEYWFVSTDNEILRWSHGRRLFQLLADGNLYHTLLKHLQDLHNQNTRFIWKLKDENKNAGFGWGERNSGTWNICALLSADLADLQKTTLSTISHPTERLMLRFCCCCF